MSNMEKLKSRNEIGDEFKWDLSAIFKSDEEFEQAVEQVDFWAKKLKSYEGKLKTDVTNLVAFLKDMDEADLLIEKIIVYSNQKMHEDMSISKYQGYASKAQQKMAVLAESVAFFEAELLSMEETEFMKFIQDEKAKDYRILLERILRKKEHTLSAKEEAILAKSIEMSSSADDIFSLFNNADATFSNIKDEKGNEVELTHGRYSKYMESSNRNVRKETFESYYATYMQYINTLSATFLSNMKKAKFYADVRKYDSSLNAALAESHIPTEVYDNLIETVHEFLPSMYRYVKLRKKVLGVDELHMYDVYTPLISDYHMEIPFEKAKEMVEQGLAPMGEEYISYLKEGFDNQWIDVYENKGKRSGAYSWGAYGSHPYVLLNYSKELDAVFTLAHEMGHALHSYYSDHNQPHTYAGYKIFVAEVASTCNESLLMQDLLKKAKDKKEKAYLLNHFIDQFKGTIFRQTMFAEFEKKAHEMYANGESVTAESLCDLYLQLNQLYFGEDMISDPQIAYEWARIPHFYTEFYVYQYATGFSAAIALSKKILEQGESAVEDYKKFLKGGSSKDPIDLLKMAGVDISSPEPIKAALSMFDELVKELEELL